MARSELSIPAATAIAVPERKARFYRLRSLSPYLWVLPALLIYAIFKLGPLIGGLYLSLLKWDGIEDAKFIGLANFQRMFEDEKLGPALLNNLQYAFGTVIGKTVLALFLALLLN